MVNLRIFCSATGCKSCLCFSHQLSSSFHISSALHCSMTIIYIYNLIHSLSTFSFDSWGYHLLKSAEPQAVGLSVCLKYLGKSSLPLDVKQTYRKIVISIRKTSTEQSQGSLASNHTGRPLNLKMPSSMKKKLLWEMNHWKGDRNTHQWISGCCISLPNAIQAPALGDNEGSQSDLGCYRPDTEVLRGFFVSTPAAAEIRIGPNSSPSKQQWATEHTETAIWLALRTISSHLIPSLIAASLLGFISISRMW